MLRGKKIIALCLSKVSTPDCHSIISELNNQLCDDGYRVFVYATSTDLYWNTPSEIGESSIFGLIDFDMIDVLVVLYEMIKNRKISDGLIAKAREKGIPVFIVNGKVDGCININFDYRTGFEQAVRHVFETHAVKHPHFMAGIKDNPFSEERLDVFKELTKEYGIEYSDDMVSYGDFWSGPTRDATEKLVARGKLPEAIICANDTMAVTVCAVLKQHCIMVPDDVLVTGFDGIDDVQIASPTISTYTCSNAKVAESIADILRSGYVPKNGADIDLVPAESLGQSCGCVREANINPSEYLQQLNDRFNRYQGEESHLFRMSAKVFTCGSIDEIPRLFDRAVFYNMSCVLYKECMDRTVNPLDVVGVQFRNAVVLYDADSDGDFRPYDFDCMDIVPNLDKKLDNGMPLIFTALNYLNVPIGYACFSYQNFDIDNYYKLMQCVNILNNALGGYRNMQYQQYLNEKVEEVYKLDRLTGLYNRNALVNDFETLVEELRSSREEMTFVLSDLDRLKYINDTFGHTEGDFAISAVAQVLKNACPVGALTARWGGDEMVAVFRGSCDAGALRLEMKLGLERVRRENGKSYEITSSIGIVTKTIGADDTLDSITKQADRLMYADKQAKRKQREN